MTQWRSVAERIQINFTELHQDRRVLEFAGHWIARTRKRHRAHMFEHERTGSPLRYNRAHNCPRRARFQIAFFISIEGDDDMVGYRQIEVRFRLSAELRQLAYRRPFRARSSVPQITATIAMLEPPTEIVNTNSVAADSNDRTKMSVYNVAQPISAAIAKFAGAPSSRKCRQRLRRNDLERRCANDDRATMIGDDDSAQTPCHRARWRDRHEALQ
jgi:hypothetical protein